MTININNSDVQGIIIDEGEMVILEVFYFIINKIMKDTLLGTYFLSLLDDSKIYLIISTHKCQLLRTYPTFLKHSIYSAKLSPSNQEKEKPTTAS